MKRILWLVSLAATILAIGHVTLKAADTVSTRTQAKTSRKATSDSRQAVSNAAVDTAQTSTTSKPRLVVYYFHGTQRCSNCLKIEAYTKETIDSSFASQLKDSLVVWRMINTDEDANKHYRDDYQLFTKSVVLSHCQDGKQVRWKNLDKIWEHLGDKAAFQAYIRDEVSAYLKDR